MLRYFAIRDAAADANDHGGRTDDRTKGDAYYKYESLAFKVIIERKPFRCG
jgi:hypothetical protein